MVKGLESQDTSKVKMSSDEDKTGEGGRLTGRVATEKQTPPKTEAEAQWLTYCAYDKADRETILLTISASNYYGITICFITISKLDDDAQSMLSKSGLHLL
jgi:hypothetical protein